ncbi:MAG: hypothetical protein ACRC2S_10575 [Waterburya sp.]
MSNCENLATKQELQALKEQLAAQISAQEPKINEAKMFGIQALGLISPIRIDLSN